MKKEKIKEKNAVSIKDYALILLMLIAAILISIYVYNYYQYKKDNHNKESYLSEHNLVTNRVNSLSELKQVLNESPSRLILYITYHSKKTYDIEKKLEKELAKYDVQDNLYIFDITKMKEKSDKYGDVINDSLDINVTGFPVIVYYEDGQIVSYKKIKNYKDIINIFKKYNFEKYSL